MMKMKVKRRVVVNPGTDVEIGQLPFGTAETGPSEPRNQLRSVVLHPGEPFFRSRMVREKHKRGEQEEDPSLHHREDRTDHAENQKNHSGGQPQGGSQVFFHRLNGSPVRSESLVSMSAERPAESVDDLADGGFAADGLQDRR
jgi:hypothetical protein